MKGKQLLALCILGLVATIAVANNYGPYYQAPEMPAYFAHKPPKPPLKERASKAFYWLQNFYISGFGGVSSYHVNSIKSNQPTIPALLTIPSGSSLTLSKTSISETQAQGGVIIGYRFKPSGLFSRVAIVYIYHPSVDYNLNPVFSNLSKACFPVQTLNSDLQTHLILFNVYYDIDLSWHVVPFIQAGVGASINDVNLKSSFTVIDPAGLPFSNTDERSKTNTSVAGDVGVGLRYFITHNLIIFVTHNLIIFVNYQFDYMGEAKWEFDTGSASPLGKITLDSGSLYSNSVNAGVTIQIT